MLDVPYDSLHCTTQCMQVNMIIVSKISKNPYLYVGIGAHKRRECTLLCLLVQCNTEMHVLEGICFVQNYDNFQ